MAQTPFIIEFVQQLTHETLPYLPAIGLCEWNLAFSVC